MRNGLIRFMRAHGQIPAPGQRPRVAGALAGLLGGIGATAVLHWSGAALSLGTALGLPSWLVLLLYPGIAGVAGFLYGALFRRAASDRRGGWLFGISYGFLVWMLGPITLAQGILGRPFATGTAAIGVLGANLVFGMMLGLLFRPVHSLVRSS